MVRRRFACAVLGAAVVCMPAVAGAQAFRLGGTFSLGGTTVPVEMPDVAYDSASNRYLQVAGKGNIEAHLLNGAGAIIATFNVTHTGVYGQNPRVAFSPHVAGGGGYLVTWHASVGDIARVRGRIFDRNGNGLTGEFDIATSATSVLLSTQWTMGAPAAAATGSAEFLVVWGANKFTTADVYAQRIGVNGEFLGGNFLVSGGGADLYDRDPSVAYNAASHKFLVGWGIYNEAGRFGYAAARTVQAGSGALGNAQNFGAAVGVMVTSVASNDAANQFLFAWFNQTSSSQYHYGVLLNGDGAAISDIKMLSAYYSSYDALDVDFNAFANEYFLITHGRNQEDAGVTLTAAGNAYDNGFLVTDTGNVTGNFNPRVAASTAEKKWLVVTSTQFSRTSAQFVASNGGGGGTPPPPPPPPPPGPGPGGAFERSHADFDGDGGSDLLWQNLATGLMSIWEMSSTGGIRKAAFLSHKLNDLNWRIVGTGDFNGDSKPDILWRHSVNGELVVWYQNGTTLIGSDYLSISQVADTRWKIEGVGDFNSDGKPDIIWQHDTGLIAAWLMNGVTVASSRLLTPDTVVDTQWKIAGVGDFNGDGHGDLLWRHANGWTVIWTMKGTTQTATASLSPAGVDTAWRIASVIDANGDGKPDIVWQHSNGWVALWLMNGAYRFYTVSIGQVSDLNWKLAGPK